MKYEDPERYAEWRPEDLVPMTLEDHARLHTTGRKHSEETKKKISKSHMGIGKGIPTWNKGLSKETDSRLAEMGKKISQTKKGKPGYAPNKGQHWYNNGIKNVFANECPEGYIPGRIH